VEGFNQVEMLAEQHGQVFVSFGIPGLCVSQPISHLSCPQCGQIFSSGSIRSVNRAVR